MKYMRFSNSTLRVSLERIGKLPEWNILMIATRRCTDLRVIPRVNFVQRLFKFPEVGIGFLDSEYLLVAKTVDPTYCETHTLLYE